MDPERQLGALANGFHEAIAAGWRQATPSAFGNCSREKFHRNDNLLQRLQ
jgi:hypothetical protein